MNKKIHLVYIDFYNDLPKSETGKRKTRQTTEMQMYLFSKKTEMEKCVLYHNRFEDTNEYYQGKNVKSIGYGDTRICKSFNKNNL